MLGRESGRAKRHNLNADFASISPFTQKQRLFAMKTEIIDLAEDIFVDLTADPPTIDLTIDDSDSDLEVTTRPNRWVHLIANKCHYTVF